MLDVFAKRFDNVANRLHRPANTRKEFDKTHKDTKDSYGQIKQY